MDQLRYDVEFEPFTERHYIKKYRKTYKEPNDWGGDSLHLNLTCPAQVLLSAALAGGGSTPS